MLGVLLVTLLVGAGLATVYVWTPQVSPSPPEGVPLLEDGDKPFDDPQVGLRFTPLPGWAMQVRTTEAPNYHVPERRIVKYKRIVKGPNVAWMRVIVKDAEGDPKPAEELMKRKPPEPDFKVSKEVEADLTVAGMPAARLTYSGALDPDRIGTRPFTSEVVAVRRGKQTFIFAATFVTADTETQQQIRKVLDSVQLESGKSR